MSEDTVRRLCRNNELPAAKLGKNWLIDKEKLRAKFGM
ncbi:MAG: helix-turn-helix domain-containing protein [Oscillospiraceae bacterium]|nr:helix-turn-helix domain-containing protein [Oscillospiraceae bacterium]